MPSSGDISILYVPCGSEEEAARIAGTLIEERLVACGNILASRSLYRWQGKVADEIEHVLLCKTSKAMAGKAQERIAELHSYELPCIISVAPESVNSEYARWVHEQVSPSLASLAVAGASDEVSE